MSHDGLMTFKVLLSACVVLDWAVSTLLLFLYLKKSVFFPFTSETRLVEIMEGLCDESASEVCF